MPATVHSAFREQWRELRRGRPGQRFQQRYERAQQESQRCGPARRIAFVAVGLLFLGVGAVLAVIPGPAIPFLFVAGGLLAAESRTIARFMDWAEVWGRKLLAWAKRQWRTLSLIGRLGVVALAASGSAFTLYLTYRVLRG